MHQYRHYPFALSLLRSMRDPGVFVTIDPTGRCGCLVESADRSSRQGQELSAAIAVVHRRAGSVW